MTVAPTGVVPWARWGLQVDVADLAGNDTAVFSPDRAYRYALTRIWNPVDPIAVWVMLNPSTADAFTVDPTIRRCLGFAQAWGCGGITVLNLFAVRATKPAVMRVHPEPIGEHNNRVIAAVQNYVNSAVWVAAWGADGSHLGRDAEVRELLTSRGVRLHCLSTTKAGQPRHPLYVPASTPLTALPLAAPSSTDRRSPRK